MGGIQNADDCSLISTRHGEFGPVTDKSDMGVQDEGRTRLLAELQHKTEVLEKELRRKGQETQFRLLVEAVQDYAIFMLDPTGYVRTWNLGAGIDI
jgi:hypothetical protein